MTFGERLIQLRKEQGYATRNELAQQLGIPGTTLRNYETNAREPGHKFLKQVSEKFNVPVDYLLCLTDEKERVISQQLKQSEFTHITKYRKLDPHGKEMTDMVVQKELERIEQQNKPLRVEEVIEPDNVIELKFANSKVSAGTGFYLIDDGYERLKVISTNETQRADICITVSGNSMEPRYFDGDILLVRKQPSIDVGEIGIFMINDEGFVKKKGSDRLISLNAEYDDIYPREYDEVLCYGKVISVLEENLIVER